MASPYFPSFSTNKRYGFPARILPLQHPGGGSCHTGAVSGCVDDSENFSGIKQNYREPGAGRTPIPSYQMYVQTEISGARLFYEFEGRCGIERECGGESSAPE